MPAFQEASLVLCFKQVESSKKKISSCICPRIPRTLVDGLPPAQHPALREGSASGSLAPGAIDQEEDTEDQRQQQQLQSGTPKIPSASPRSNRKLDLHGPPEKGTADCHSSKPAETDQPI
jgi:hypothetical protein